MPATTNSVYQALRAQHVAGVPPDCDPQRASETFNSYFVRMQGHALLPDIDATESDADYLARLRSYQAPVPTLNVTASYSLVSETEIGTVTTAATASYVLGSGVSGRVTSAATSSYISSSATFDANKTYNLSASYAPVV